MTALVTILVFLMVVMIHEFGHFITAKLFGVHVIEFAVGMGPKLISKKYKETIYSLRALPLGGFCMMEGEDQEEYSMKSINSQPAWKRFVVMAAGAFNNIVLAFLLFTILFFKIGGYSNVIENVMPQMPAQIAGVQAGDKILSIDEKDIVNWQDINRILGEGKGNSVLVEIKRDEHIIKLPIIPVYVEEYDRYMLGVEPKIQHTIGVAMESASSHMINIVKQTLGVLGRLFQFQDVSKEVSGPVGIIKMVGEATRYGIYAVIEIAALISLSLGIFNLLPFPALDGGRILFILIEKIIRRPVNKTIEGYFHLVGFILLIGLTILITIKDLSK